MHLTDDSVVRVKNGFASNDRNVVISNVQFQGGDMKKLAEMSPLEMFSVQKANLNDKVIIIADTRHTQIWSEREFDPVLCN